VSTIAGATVRVDCGAPQGPVRRIWTSLGFDEINWTSMPAGRRHLRTIGAFAEQPYYVRSHYVFNSGIGASLPHWGAGNVYHEDAAGRPVYDFSIADQVYDAVIDAGHRPLVELAFTPRALVPEDAEARFAFEPSPTQWSPYEAGLWATPPRDYDRWGGLVRALVVRVTEDRQMPRSTEPNAAGLPRCCRPVRQKYRSGADSRTEVQPAWTQPISYS